MCDRCLCIFNRILFLFEHSRRGISEKTLVVVIETCNIGNKLSRWNLYEMWLVLRNKQFLKWYINQNLIMTIFKGFGHVKHGWNCFWSAQKLGCNQVVMMRHYWTMNFFPSYGMLRLRLGIFKRSWKRKRTLEDFHEEELSEMWWMKAWYERCIKQWYLMAFLVGLIYIQNFY